MNEKKVVGINAAITLGIVCIILALVIGVNAVILNNNIAQYNDYVLNHSHVNYDYTLLNASLYQTRGQLDDLTNILHLENSTNVYTNPYEIELPANFSTEPEKGEYALSSDPPFGQYAGIAYVQVSSSS